MDKGREAQPSARDDNRIDLNDAGQVRYWTTNLAVTDAQLRAAVEAVGSEPQKIRDYLARTIARP